MKALIMLLLVASSLLITGCHSHDDHEGHDHSEHDHEGHDHGATLDVITYTLWDGNTELFLEFSPFLLKKSNPIRVVLTSLDNFQALPTDLSIHINNGTKIKAKSSQTGIYEASLTFQKAGNQKLIFVLGTGTNKRSIVLKDLPVFENQEAAFRGTHPTADAIGSINYQRKDAWNNLFKVETVQQKPVGTIVHTSGIIEPSTTDLSTLVAKRDGVVNIRKKNLTSGAAVRARDLLFTVTGKGIVEDDLEMNFIKAQSNLERQKSNLERKKKLLIDNIIGQKEYEQALNEYELAEAEFNNIRKLFNKGEKRHLVSSPTTGFVSQLLVQEGQFVKAGQPLASILKTSRVQIKVDVSPRYRALLPTIVNANFVNPYTDKAYSMLDLEGRVISFGRMTSHAEGHYIPLYFEINNHPDLSPGAMVEVFLMTQANTQQLSVPLSAVLEEMGSYVTFVQKSAETYEKQVVEIGANDGKMVQILSGLSLGDKVITQGALQVKLASMSAAVDPHAGHNH
ncbi:MAG: Probable Co/Zn/Cd efflux system membrane fusion protein [uncultured Aureispira sp.]|uniref:Probable Co/Zn/Cd efflux system membrane fusion protein n=1 Tax=uncultured Aureispira sp. TaxID=1331704 RepID=A0A6S6SCX6_9BACT|nr:MAG: Probable Co/Zn/Cd efflux system membrane fusion protein [uncultured Aureispira sp.]